MFKFGALLLGWFVWAPWVAWAQTSVELGGEAAALNQGLGYWEGLYGTLTYAQTRDRLSLELAYASRFGEQGASATGSWQRDYSRDAYQIFSMDGSSAGDFWPTFGASTEYFRKLGPDRDWVAGLAAGGDTFRTGNSDWFGLLEGIRYFPHGWVLEAGTRVNLSQPGNVAAPRAFVALSWVDVPELQLDLKLDAGDEAYQVVAPGTVVTRFQSIGVTLGGLVPIGGGRQIHFRLEQYDNPYYDRWLAYLGVSQPF